MGLAGRSLETPSLTNDCNYWRLQTYTKQCWLHLLVKSKLRHNTKNNVRANMNWKNLISSEDLASRPDSTKFETIYAELGARKIRYGQMYSRLCGVKVRSRGYRLRCRPRHLKMVRNDEVHPTIALM
ncbi:hypothetical protein AVEN_133610-1 [Araneus ventricosus]|uniref:Uncharacterized protein n=1 Tax=Araneus ventricosus TaxID=182803 RepID=A0A4Y2K0V8_ARAVE|nr:hypothetical protein AVEN_133610-1 [Araneus ventricosus]